MVMSAQSKDKNFKKRFGDRIVMTFLDKPLSPMEQKIQNEKVAQAFNGMLSWLLGKEPSQGELLGLQEITPRKRKSKPVTPP